MIRGGTPGLGGGAAREATPWRGASPSAPRGTAGTGPGTAAALTRPNAPPRPPCRPAGRRGLSLEPWNRPNAGRVSEFPVSAACTPATHGPRDRSVDVSAACSPGPPLPEVQKTVDFGPSAGQPARSGRKPMDPEQAHQVARTITFVGPGKGFGRGGVASFHGRKELLPHPAKTVKTSLRGLLSPGFCCIFSYLLVCARGVLGVSRTQGGAILRPYG